MTVIDHEPAGWFLLQSDGDYFLDVNCGHSFVGFSIAIQLTEEEIERYAREGRAAIVDLAGQIAARSDLRDPRNIEDKVLLESISRAILGK